MLTQISRFCTRFPWIVFSVIAGITIFMVYQITNKSTFEADITKFLPSDLAAIKSDDYYKKNFNYQDTLLIGLENESGSVLEMPILRLMESLTFDLKEMSAQKTFYSKLKGESVTLTQSMGIDPDTVSAAANLEDAILDKETGSVISGSVIKKLKKDRGIVSASGKEDLLPESDSDLKLIIPDLKEHIMRDSTFRGSILSVDLKAATIRAATIRRWTYKKRYAESELSAAIDENILKQRFSGKDSTFPFEIYGKTIDKTEINDAYIVKHTADVKIR
ncbi:hypothetical protein KKA14_11540, partial [bacterium]|nr:hypothetical protein [bacterium]